MVKRLKKALHNVGKFVKIVSIPIILFHGATQLVYWGNDIINGLNPSEKRIEFKKEFGFPIRGWENDIEEKPVDISDIGIVFYCEQVEKPFDIGSIRIRSDNYLKKSIVQQIDDAIFSNLGYYTYYGIVIDDLILKSTISHEIKHAKTFDIIKNNPDFIKKWKELSNDNFGNSLYLNNKEQLQVYMGLEHLVNEDKIKEEENKNLGFVTNYARTNIYEDIAELGELAETNIINFIEWFGYRYEPKNEKIIAKVKLAQEYGIIPKEFSEYVYLESILDNADVGDESIWNSKKAEEFFYLSEKFLEENKETIYQSELRNKRAWIIQHRFDDEESVIAAIFEYKLSLRAKYKEPVSYKNSLESLSKCFKLLDCNEEAKIYDDALKEYEKRYAKGDVLLGKSGVNDFLTSKGEILEHIKYVDNN